MGFCLILKKQLLMKSLNERIVIDPTKCNGRPVIKGTRITVNAILEYLAAGDSVEEILSAYSQLEKADVLACLDFAAKLANNSYTIKPVA